MHYHFGLIGYPIKHSLSPWIHQQFLERTNLEGDYSIIEINPNSSFEEAISSLKEMQLNGFNITVPHKQAIISYLDEVDDSALQIGAVNTVLYKNSRWIGFNTDGMGYVRSLQSQFPQVTMDKYLNILILGAGGAAKGIYHALHSEGYEHITISNRTTSKAEEITGSKDQVITLEKAKKDISHFDVIVQTTSVGMKPETDNAVISLEGIKTETIVSDIVYQPLMTKFLRQANALGAHIHFGHTMLLYQAQYAFEIWTNKNPIMDNLDSQLKKILEG